MRSDFSNTNSAQSEIFLLSAVMTYYTVVVHTSIHHKFSLYLWSALLLALMTLSEATTPLHTLSLHRAVGCKSLVTYLSATTVLQCYWYDMTLAATEVSTLAVCPFYFLYRALHVLSTTVPGTYQ